VRELGAARNFHLRVVKETGLTTADELLYPEAYAYFQDIVSYLAIGVRSVGNQ
jgi:3-deoxy-7-phosphoheptulonate synthase